MNNFVFQNATKIYFGEGEIRHLGEEIQTYGKKVLLVYGGGSIKRSGIYDAVMAQLRGAGMEVFEQPGIEPNPRHTTVNHGAEICKKEGVDVVLAVGGGSVIDATKAIAAAACYEGSDVWDLVKGKAAVTGALPILAVLTIAATGSEMDCGGVISNMETKEKLPFVHPLLQSKVSFLDPTYTYTVSAYQTAAGSVDIMSHIFDTVYFAKDERMDMLYGMMDQLLRTVVKYAPEAIAQPDSYEARANLMWASTWALNGFLSGGIAQDPSCHFIEHELSAVYDITHGHGLAIVTPAWLRYILNDETAPQISRLGTNVFGLAPSPDDREGALAAIDALEDFFFNKLGLSAHLSDLGIGTEQFSHMAEKACGAKGCLDGPVKLTPEDVTAIFNQCV